MEPLQHAQDLEARLDRGEISYQHTIWAFAKAAASGSAEANEWIRKEGVEATAEALLRRYPERYEKRGPSLTPTSSNVSSPSSVNFGDVAREEFYDGYQDDQ